jgi:hypothetical protein
MKKAAALFATAVAAVATLSLAACGDTTEPGLNLFNDSTTTVDIAASSGDAMATSVQGMIDNETAAGGGADFVSSSASLDVTKTGDWNRNKTCLDANNAVVANCLPFSSVKKIVIQATLNVSRSGTSQTNGGAAATWTGAVHRSWNDTTTRNFTNTTETSRTHNGNEVVHDTTTFTDAKMSRLMAEAAHDSSKNIVFNLPRSQNPWPASGSLVRVDSVHVAITAGDKSVTKDLVRTVTVAFPADAQGNVVLTVNGKTCNLNLVTHVVSACH